MIAKKQTCPDEDYCVAANGAMYRKDEVGFMPKLVTRIYNERKEYKRLTPRSKNSLTSKRNLSVADYELLSGLLLAGSLSRQLLLARAV